MCHAPKNWRLLDVMGGLRPHGGPVSQTHDAALRIIGERPTSCRMATVQNLMLTVCRMCSL